MQNDGRRWRPFSTRCLVLMVLQELCHETRQLVVFRRQGRNAAVVFVAHFVHLSFHFRSHVLHAFLELADFGFQAIHVVFGLLFGLGCTFDLMQQLGSVSLELGVIESNVTGRLRIDIVRQDGIRSQFSESVKIELPGKAGKVGVLKVCKN